MDEVQMQRPGEQQNPSPLNRVVRLIPPKARLAALSGSVVLIALLCYTSLSAGTATLNLVCRSALRSGEIEISLDGHSIYADNLSAASHLSSDPKKLFGILGKRTQTLSRTLAVAAGDHLAQVRVTSPADGFDETSQRQMKLTAGSESTLLVTAERSGLSVSFKPIATTEQQNGSGYAGLLRSMLVMISGSAVSAAIGFVVTEFLRSKRTA